MSRRLPKWVIAGTCLAAAGVAASLLLPRPASSPSGASAPSALVLVFEQRRGAAPGAEVRPEVWALVAPVEPPGATIPEGGRMELLGRLGKTLSKAEVEEICWFLEEVPVVEGMDRAFEAGLKNDLMTLLGEQPASGSRVCRALCRTASDPRQREILRDYAIQHLGLWHDSFSEPDRAAVQEVFWQAAESGAGSLGGTALLNLKALETGGKLISGDRARLVRTANRIAAGPLVPEPARMAALEILRESKPEEALELARQLARGTCPPTLLHVAVAVLATCGTPEDVAWLRQSPLAEERRYRPLLEKTFSNN